MLFTANLFTGVTQPREIAVPTYIFLPTCLFLSVCFPCNKGPLTIFSFEV